MAPALSGSPENKMQALMGRIGIDPRIQDYVTRSIRFHTHAAPGVIISVFMVDLALELLGARPGERLYAVCETKKCAPDPLQVILGCTAGNKRLQVLPIGRFALTLNRPSERATTEGVRVFVDPKKLPSFPTIQAWYSHAKGFDKKGREDALYEEILRAGRKILSHELVRVKVPRKAEWDSGTCACCGEMVPADLLEGDTCRGCGSMAYYEEI
ncbi:MAG TPA: FmdE family protein [Methanomicrobiales archaeon]|nr:FmdE family protein [Methanomicrobiales archaeon]